MFVFIVFCLILIDHASMQWIGNSSELHPLCNKTNLKIVGTSAIKDSLFIFVNDNATNQIVVYEVPAKNVVPLLGKIFINSKVDSLPLKEYCGYDPMAHGKIPQSMFILEGPRKDDLTLTFLFENDKHTAQSVACTVQKPYDSLKLNGTQNAIVWGNNLKGLHFIRGNELKNWIARDVTFLSEQLWFGSNFYNVLMDGDNKMIFRLEDNFPASEKHVQWNSINGFVHHNLYVMLFVDQHILMFVDPFIGEHPQYDFTIELGNFAYDEVFWCQEEVPDAYLESVAPEVEDTSKAKMYIIYALFGLHFLAASIMLAIIIKLYVFDSKSMLPSSTKQQSISKVRRSSKGQSTKSGKTQNSDNLSNESNTTVQTQATKSEIQ